MRGIVEWGLVVAGIALLVGVIAERCTRR